MRKNILTIVAIVIASVSALSQSVTETRHIKTTALQVYENYKVVMSGLYSRSAYTEDNFIALYENNALIYNDILPDNHPQQLSPPAYFEKFRKSIKRIYPSFSDFKMGEPVSVGDKWQIKCNYTRGTSFMTQKDMKYPEWSFNYTMTIEMEKLYNITNKVYQHARIISIEVDNPLTGFFIIENKEDIPLVTKSGNTLSEWDEENQTRIFPDYEWKINDIRFHDSMIKGNNFGYTKGKFSKNQTDAHFYRPYVQRYNKNIFGIGVNYSNAFAFGNKMSEVNAENFKDITYTSNALSLSFFYGKQIAHKEKSNVFVNFGLDFNKYSYEYSGANYAVDSTYNGVHADDDPHLRYRTISIDSLEEKISIVSVSVPVSIEYLYQLTQQTKNPVFLSFELGLFAECALSSRSKYNLNADYRGFYDYFDVIEFDHYYDYGNFDVSGNQKLNSRLSGGIFGGIGLWFSMNDSNLLKFNVSYKHSFSSPLEFKENYVISQDKDSYQSLLYSTNQGMKNIRIGISWVKTIGGNK